MTLDAIWYTDRADIRLVAYIPGTLDYVSLAHGSADAAFAASAESGLAAELRGSMAWEIGTIEAGADGQVSAIVPV